ARRLQPLRREPDGGPQHQPLAAGIGQVEGVHVGAAQAGDEAHKLLEKTFRARLKKLLGPVGANTCQYFLQFQQRRPPCLRAPGSEWVRSCVGAPRLPPAAGPMLGQIRLPWTRKRQPRPAQTAAPPGSGYILPRPRAARGPCPDAPSARRRTRPRWPQAAPPAESPRPPGHRDSPNRPSAHGGCGRWRSRFQEIGWATPAADRRWWRPARAPPRPL